MIQPAPSNRRWPLTDEQRKVAVARLMDIVQGDDEPLAIRACRVLLACEAQNAADERHDDRSDDNTENRVLDLLAKARRGNQHDNPN